jgi:hypothetical protein
VSARSLPAIGNATVSSIFLRAVLALTGFIAFVHTARADMAVSATSPQSTYVAGRTNTFALDLKLTSAAWENVDNIRFAAPAGVAISAIRHIDGFHTCPDGIRLVLGMGTPSGGWVHPGHPSGCGYFGGAPYGEPQAVQVDLDIPAAYAGSLPLTIYADGDTCCGDAPHDGNVTLTFAPDPTIVAGAPRAAVGPDTLAVAMKREATQNAALGIVNVGGGTLGYAVAFADGQAADCATPANLPWLRATRTSGALAAGESADAGLVVDTHGQAAGTYTALVCVATNDASASMRFVRVTADVSADACDADDRVFADGFDGIAAACGEARGVYANRDAFVASVAPGYSEERYTGLRTGYLYGPVEFGNDDWRYRVYSHDGAVGGLYLFPGAGVMSTAAAFDHLTITFTGAPVTALGGNFYGTLFHTNTSTTMHVVPTTRVVLTLDDGTVETFTASARDAFRGIVATKPIRTLTIATPDEDVDGNIAWGVADNLIVGRRR